MSFNLICSKCGKGWFAHTHNGNCLPQNLYTRWTPKRIPSQPSSEGSTRGGEGVVVNQEKETHQ